MAQACAASRLCRRPVPGCLTEGPAMDPVSSCKLGTTSLLDRGAIGSQLISRL